MAAYCAEQPALAILVDAGSVDVSALRFGERMMARHTVLFAAFPMQPDCPSGAAGPEVFDLHPSAPSCQRRVRPAMRFWLIGVQLLDGIGAGVFGALTPLVIADNMRGTGRYNLAQGAIATVHGIGAPLGG